MMDNKSLLDAMEKGFVSSLGDWTQWLENARGNVEGLDKEKNSTAAKNIVVWLDKARQSMESAKANIEAVTNILNARKASLGLKKIVVESWPKRVWIDRLTYISTALFGLGGVPFVLSAGQVTVGAFISALVVWLTDLTLMGISLT